MGKKNAKIKVKPLNKEGLKFATKLFLYLEKRLLSYSRSRIFRKGKISLKYDRWAISYLCLMTNYDMNKIINRSTLNDFLSDVRQFIFLLRTHNKGLANKNKHK